MEFLLDQELIDKYTNYSFDAAIERDPDQYSFCPTTDCGYVFFWEEADGSDFVVDYHTGSTCEQFKEWQRENGQADDLFEQFVTRQNFKSCPKCKRWVQKAEGKRLFMAEEEDVDVLDQP
eukprot:gene19398-23223_t